MTEQEMQQLVERLPSSPRRIYDHLRASGGRATRVAVTRHFKRRDGMTREFDRLLSDGLVREAGYVAAPGGGGRRVQLFVVVSPENLEAVRDAYARSRDDRRKPGEHARTKRRELAKPHRDRSLADWYTTRMRFNQLTNLLQQQVGPMLENTIVPQHEIHELGADLIDLVEIGVEALQQLEARIEQDDIRRQIRVLVRSEGRTEHERESANRQVVRLKAKLRRAQATSGR